MMKRRFLDVTPTMDVRAHLARRRHIRRFVEPGMSLYTDQGEGHRHRALCFDGVGHRKPWSLHQHSSDQIGSSSRCPIPIASRFFYIIQYPIRLYPSNPFFYI